MKIGIDLGTTNSVMSYYTEDGDTEIIQNDNGEKKTPSVVYIREQGDGIAKDPERVTVGNAAVQQRPMYPERVLERTKQDIHKDEEVTYEVGDDDEEYTPGDAAAYILGHLKEQAEQKTGEEVTGAVITVPYYFSNEGRKTTKKAGEKAGINVEEVINEPTAACLTYISENDIEDNLLVYDLGGGTFDATLVNAESLVIEVVSTEGDGELGGEDFDEVLYEDVRQRIIDEGGEDPENLHKRERADLRSKVKTAKHNLSDVDSHTIVYSGGDEPVEIEITEKEFRNDIEEFIDDTVDKVEELFNKDTVKEAGISKEDVDHVLLVGGSTRIPLVREKVEEFFGQKPNIDIDADTAVARGAAIHAADYGDRIDSEDLPDYVIQDVLSHNLGVELAGETFDEVIEEDQSVPHSITKDEYYNAGKSSKLKIPIWERADQGQDLSQPGDAKDLGVLELSGIPRKDPGEIDVEVTFEAQSDGTLNVEAAAEGEQTSKELDVELGGTGEIDVNKEENNKPSAISKDDEEDNDKDDDEDDEDSSTGIEN